MGEPKAYDEVVIDGVRYLPSNEIPLAAETKKLLSEVYGELWTESFYDPFNEATEKFAKRLYPKMKRLNELLGFSK